jgi:polyhydroxybutyrate depolymerase
MIRMPDGASAAKPVGAIVYFHGFRSSAAASMRFESLVRVAEELGVALIAPDGLEKSWSFPNAPRARRDELAFMHLVLDDALARFPIDPARVMSAGFSIGGTMSWYMACYLGERFAGHTPISGTFWRPHPAECPGPDPFISHVHGTADKVFPLEGRLIRQTWQQGNTPEAVAFFRTRGGNAPVVEHYQDGKLDCTNAATVNGGAVELCLHEGGHSVRGEWIKRGWMRLAAFKGWTEFKQAAKDQD